jgi:hypothetical protein
VLTRRARCAAGRWRNTQQLCLCLCCLAITQHRFYCRRALLLLSTRRAQARRARCAAGRWRNTQQLCLCLCCMIFTQPDVLQGSDSGPDMEIDTSSSDQVGGLHYMKYTRHSCASILLHCLLQDGWFVMTIDRVPEVGVAERCCRHTTDTGWLTPLFTAGWCPQEQGRDKQGGRWCCGVCTALPRCRCCIHPINLLYCRRTSLPRLLLRPVLRPVLLLPRRAQSRRRSRTWQREARWVAGAESAPLLCSALLLAFTQHGFTAGHCCCRPYGDGGYCRCR